MNGKKANLRQSFRGYQRRHWNGPSTVLARAGHVCCREHRSWWHAAPIRLKQSQPGCPLSDCERISGSIQRARVSALGNADRQKLEIMRALIHGAGMMILDEPTAVLTPADTYELFEQLSSYIRDGGTVVLITHKLDDAIRHADEVTVLRQGRVVLHSPMRNTSATKLSGAMLGVREKESRAISPAPAISGRTSSPSSLTLRCPIGSDAPELYR